MSVSLEGDLRKHEPEHDAASQSETPSRNSLIFVRVPGEASQLRSASLLQIEVSSLKVIRAGQAQAPVLLVSGSGVYGFAFRRCNVVKPVGNMVKPSGP